jgi:class 3 adenylate cyclase
MSPSDTVEVEEETGPKRTVAPAIWFWRDGATSMATSGPLRESVGGLSSRCMSPPEVGGSIELLGADQTVSSIVPRLSVVLAADVAEYCRLMELDARDIILRLRTMRRELVEPVTKACGASMVRYAGDSILAEFVCVVGAVSCAIAIQRGLPLFEQGIPEERRMRLRIGISAGHVFHVDGDLHGTSVNVAARLQALAEPGDIYLSEAALSQARNQLPLRYQSLGKRQLKNMATPVHIFRIPREEIIKLPSA